MEYEQNPVLNSPKIQRQARGSSDTSTCGWWGLLASGNCRRDREVWQLGCAWIFSGHYVDYHMDNRGYTAYPQSGPEIIDKV